MATMNATEKTLITAEEAVASVMAYRNERQQLLEDFVQNLLYPTTCAAIKNVSRKGALKLKINSRNYWSDLLDQAGNDDKRPDFGNMKLQQEEYASVKYAPKLFPWLERGVFDMLADLLIRDGFHVCVYFKDRWFCVRISWDHWMPTSTPSVLSQWLPGWSTSAANDKSKSSSLSTQDV